MVSDTFASALWSGDYMLQVAQAGYIGVNLHGGGNGLYTPIAGDTPEGFSARPVYYGMMLAERFAGSTFVEASLSGAERRAERDRPSRPKRSCDSHGSHGLKLAIFNKAAAPVTNQNDRPVRLRERRMSRGSRRPPSTSHRRRHLRRKPC